MFLIVWYYVGFVFFVLTLTRGYYRVQFSLVREHNLSNSNSYIDLQCIYINNLRNWNYIVIIKYYNLEVYVCLFLQLAWTKITLIMFVLSSHLFIQNVYEGIYWFLMPVSLVICNDIMAYVSGKTNKYKNTLTMYVTIVWIMKPWLMDTWSYFWTLLSKHGVLIRSCTYVVLNCTLIYHDI